MKVITNINQAMDELERVGKYYFEHIFTKEIPKMERVGEVGENEKEDSNLSLKINGWIIITPFHTTEKTVAINMVTRPAIHYKISKVVVYRGNEWEPDDVDVVELDVTCSTVTKAIDTVCKILFENELDCVAQSFTENEWATDEEEYFKELYATIINRNVMDNQRKMSIL